MTVAVIVQARRASTRLPDKVLKRLAGETVLSHVLRRCAAVPGADAVCCAIPDDPACDALAGEAGRAGATVFRGSEQDVLARTAGAAEALGAGTVLRVTSDCPLIDPEICGQVLALHREAGADYTCNTAPPSWPQGLDCEVLSGAWLARSAAEATLPSQREHVTQYVIGHPAARRANLPCPLPGLAHHRWTLDTPEDLALLTAIFERLPPGPAACSWRAALAIVEADPALAALNAGHDRWAGLRKSRAADSRVLAEGAGR